MIIRNFRLDSANILKVIGKKFFVFALGMMCLVGNLWGTQLDRTSSGTYDYSTTGFTDSQLLIDRNDYDDVIIIAPYDCTLNLLRVYGTGTCEIIVEGNVTITNLILGDQSLGGAASLIISTSTSASIQITNFDTTTNVSLLGSATKNLTISENISVSVENWNVNNDTIASKATNVDITNNGTFTVHNANAQVDSVTTTITGSGNTIFTGSISGDAAEHFIQDIQNDVIFPDTVIFESGTWTPNEPNNTTKKIIIKSDVGYTTISTLTQLTSIQILNNSVLNVADDPINIALFDSDSIGKLYSVGSVTVGENKTIENLTIINANKIIANGKHLNCKSVNAENIELTGNSAINTTEESNFGNVSCFGTSNANIKCNATHIIKDITLNKTDGIFYIWGGEPDAGINQVTVKGNIKAESGTNNVSFESPVVFDNGTNQIELSGTNSITFKKTVTSNSDLTFDDSGTITFFGKSTFNKNLTISGTTSETFSENSTVKGNLLNSGTINIADGKTLSIFGNFDDSIGTFSGDGILLFNGTENQTFTPNTATTYKNIEINKTSGNFTANSALKVTDFTITNTTHTEFTEIINVENLSITNATNTVFDESVNITNYSSTADSGNIEFKNNATITNNFTHTSGTTKLSGTLQAPNITLGDVEIIGTPSTISGDSITSGNIQASTTGTDLTLTATTGSFTLDTIGTNTTPFQKVTLDAGDSILELSDNPLEVFATDVELVSTKDIEVQNLTIHGNLQLSTSEKNTVEKINVSGKLLFTTDDKITLSESTITDEVTFTNSANVSLLGGDSNLSIGKINFPSSPTLLALSLGGYIEITEGDFWLDLAYRNVPTTLISNTTIKATQGQIALCDNIKGNKNLTINSANNFLLFDTQTGSLDPENNITSVVSQMEVANFEQSGAPLVYLEGDISAQNITFYSPITIKDNVNIYASQNILLNSYLIPYNGNETLITISDGKTTFNDSIGYNPSYDYPYPIANLYSTANEIEVHGDLLIDPSNGEIDFNVTNNVTFIGTTSSITGSKLTVTGGDIIINKNTGATLTANLPIESIKNCTLTQGTFQNTEQTTIQENLTIEQNGIWSASGDCTVIKNLTNSGDWSGTGNVTIKGNFSDSGTWAGTGDIILDGSENQTFVAGATSGTPTNYTKIILDKTSAKKITFNTNEISATEIQITGNVDFNTPVTFETVTNTATVGDITFNAGGTIKTDTTFETTGKVNFSSSPSSPFIFSDGTTNCNFTHPAGLTSASTNITAETFTVGDFSISNDVTLNCNSVIFQGGTDEATSKEFTSETKKLTVPSPGKITTSDFYNITNANINSIIENSNTATSVITNSVFSGDFTNNGTLTINNSSETGDFTNSGNTTVDNFTLNGNFSNSATTPNAFIIEENKSFYLAKNFTNNGVFTAKENSTFALIDKTLNTIISGTIPPTFEKFVAQNLGDKTLQLNCDVTVNKELTLKGSSTSSLLTITDDGSGKGFILPNGSQPTSALDDAVAPTEFAGRYLQIGESVKIKNSSGNTDGLNLISYRASDSKPIGTFTIDSIAETIAFSKVILNGWRIKKLSDLNYLWTGTSSVNWDDTNNWITKIVPGIGYTKVAKVIINDNCTNNPILQDTEYTIKKLTIGGDSQPATTPATLTLSGNANLKISDGTLGLTNNTKIIYTSTGRIVNNATTQPINDSDHGTVEYNSATGTQNIANVDYYNLLITNGTYETPNDLLVKNDLTIKNGNTTFKGLVTVNNDFNIENGNSDFQKAVTINQNALIKNSAITTFDKKITCNTFTVENTPTLNIKEGLTAKNSNIIIPSGVTVSLAGEIKSGETAGHSFIQEYNSPIALTGATTLLSKINTITCNSTIDSDANGPYSLFIGDETNATNLVATDVIGGTTPLSTLTVYGTSNIAKNITTTDAQTFTGATTLTDNIEFTSASGKLIYFKNTLKGVDLGSGVYSNLTITNANTQFDNTVSDINSLLVTGNGTTNINCNSISSMNNQTYSGAVILHKNTKLLADIKTVTFDSTVDSASGKNCSLSIGDETNATNLVANGVIGGATPLSTLTVYGTSSIAKNITTTDAQTFTGATTLTADVTLKSSTGKLINFKNTVNGTTLGTGFKPNLTIVDANSKFDNTVTDINSIKTNANSEFVSSVSINGDFESTGNSATTLFRDILTTGGNILITGTTKINCDSITSVNDQTYSGAVILFKNTSLIAGTNAAPKGVTFNATVDSDSTGPFALTIGQDFPRIATNLVANKVIGGAHPLSTLTVYGTSRVGNNITTTDAQTFTGATTLTTNVTLKSSTGTLINFQNTVNGTTLGTGFKPNLTIVDANSKFDNTVNDINSIKTNANSEFVSSVSINGDFESTGNSATTLFRDILTTGGNILVTGNSTTNTFTKTVTTGENISITGTNANTQFNASVTAIGNITLTGDHIYTNFSAPVHSDKKVTVNGDSPITIFNDTLTTQGNIAINGANSTSTFTKTVNSGESILIFGTTTFHDLVNSSNSISLSGTTKINCDSITSVNDQTYSGAVILFKNTSLIAGTNAAPKGVTFNATVDSDSTGPFALTIGQDFPRIATNLVANKVIGGAHPLSTLTVYGTSRVGNNITTTDAQTFTGATTLTTNVTLKSSTGTLINFQNTVNGTTLGTGFKPNLTIVDANSKFDNTVNDINSIKTNANSEFVSSVSINDDFESTGNSATTLFRDILTTGGNILVTGNSTRNTFTKTVTTGENITITGTNANTQFNASVTATGNITLTGDHIYTNFSAPVNSDKNVTVNGDSPITIFNDTLTTQGNIAINGANSTSTFKKDVTSHYGAITIKGSANVSASAISSKNSQTYVGELTIDSGTIELTSTAGDFSTNKISAPLNAKATISAININFHEDTNFSSANLIIKNTKLFTIDSDKTLLCKNLNQSAGQVLYTSPEDGTTSLIASTSSKNMIVGNISTTDSASKVSFETDCYILGATDTTLNGQLLCNANLILAKESQTQKITLDISSLQNSYAKNIVLYSGDLYINGNLCSVDDVVLLGASYNTTDHVSGVQNAYIYEVQRFGGEVEGAKNLYTFETYFPSSTGSNIPIPTKQGALQINLGIKLIVGRNFYANGLSIKGDIQLTDNTNSSSTFAEAYNCEISESKVSCSTSSGSAKIACENCTFTGDEANIQNYDSDDLTIIEAFTVRDNVVFVKFNRAIRNKNNELQKVIQNKYLTLSNEYKYIGAYTDRDCQTEFVNKDDDHFYLKVEDEGVWNTDATGLHSGAENSTDRNGKHRTQIPFLDIVRNHVSGEVNFPWLITDIYGKRLVNYSTDSTKTPTPQAYPFTDVEDHTGPVLYKVRTGQENHIQKTGQEDIQHSYDAHNFIEFRYSEAVNFGDSSGKLITDTTPIFDNTNTSPENTDFWLPALSTDEIQNENIRVNSIFGAISGDVRSENNINLTNLATFEKGKMHTGTRGADSKYVNAIYRIDPFTIRYSIAGFTDGTITDQYGNIYKNWIGYIENAVMPSGKVSIITNNTEKNEAESNVEYNYMVTDCATKLDGTTALFNKQEKYKVDINTNVELTVVPEVNSTKNVEGIATVDVPTGLYGKWDLSEPVFAPLRTKKTEKYPWSAFAPENNNWYESVGNTNGGGSTLQKIEFHLFDNTPDYNNDPFEWLSKTGWIETVVNSKNLYKDYSYCADIIGGSRAFGENATNRTSGGIRFSSINNVQNAFMYTTRQDEDATPDTPFANNETAVYPGAKASLFTGSSAAQRSADILDGLYFGIQLSNTTYPLTQVFTISYDESKGYITDLAGNRLRSSIIRTMDRTPPSYDFTITPISQDEIHIIFVKDIITDLKDLEYKDTNGHKMPINEPFEQLLPKCFELFTMNSNGEATTNNATKLQIDYKTPAKIEKITSSLNKNIFTYVKFKLNRNITLKDLEETYIRVIIPEGYTESQDPITGINNSRVTFIQDEQANYMQDLQAHALSDFAVSSVNPLYAYDQDMEYNNEQIMNGLYQEGSWAVHNWNAEQQNYGTLPADHPIGIVADLLKGDDSKSSSASDTKTKGMRLFLSASQPKNAVSKQINQDLNKDYRIWLPSVMDGEFPFIAQENVPVENFTSVDSVFLDEKSLTNRFLFNIPKTETQKWGSNQQVSFLFGFLDENKELIRIYNAPFYDVSKKRYNLSLSTYVPLYALRLLNPADVTSLDLWSYKTKAQIEQRGGVTILNNVINVTNGEKVAIKVNMHSEGKLNVMVMTLDGNIITYLQHGKTTGGEHYYSWNGKNENGNAVARGMYFIRVVGNGIDETRKVIVVK